MTELTGPPGHPARSVRWSHPSQVRHGCREIGTVVGRGGVTFVDGSSVRYNNSGDVTHGPELTISALRVGIIGTGQKFNLKKREVEALLRAPSEQ